MKKIVILLILVAVVVGVAYLIATRVDKDDGAGQQEEEKVKFEHVDLSQASGNDRLPPGFPADIPVETDTAIESYVGNYTDLPGVQRTFSYKSGQTPVQKFNEYKKYMTDNGYEFNEENEGTVYSLVGDKDNDTLSVVTSVMGQQTLVQITYIDR